ncbi:MAG: TetR/AcrR family transcriptional regulator [Polyangiaceae bacterium]
MSKATTSSKRSAPIERREGGRAAVRGGPPGWSSIDGIERREGGRAAVRGGPPSWSSSGGIEDDEREPSSTKQLILARAFELARKVGLSGLSIGSLADATSMSKSGLFAHFKSKDALVVQVLGEGADRFVEAVVRPALKKPRGVPRLRAMVDGWLGWGIGPDSRGCLLAAASFELDDQPGPARDALVRHQRDWLDTLAQAVQIAVAEGHLAAGTDARRVAFELHGIMLAAHQAARLLDDPDAASRARKSFEHLVRSYQA